jgi:cytoskeletal protein RodZ
VRTNQPAADKERPDRPSYGKIAGIGCAVLLGIFVLIGVIGSTTNQNSSAPVNASDSAADTNPTSVDTNSAETPKQATEEDTSSWSYSQDEDKVRGGTTYYARTTSTNSIAQSFPYDSDTTMSLTVRKSPAYGTDVVLTISSGQMMCPSYEGCSGTVRFDNGPAQHVSLNGPADNSRDTVFVVGAKQFIAKLKAAKKVTIEKTLYEAGNPQFEFDVRGLKWDH